MSIVADGLDHAAISRRGRVAGKTAVVTGAATGLGAAIATLLAQEGASVAAFDRNPAGKDIAEAITSTGGRAKFWAVDVTDEEGVLTAMLEAFGEFGRLDILVNNAGISGPDEPTDQVSWGAWVAHGRRSSGSTSADPSCAPSTYTAQ